jgi:TM2 domain-containing membrane protein YozV
MTEQIVANLKINGNYQDIPEKSRNVAVCSNCKVKIDAEAAKFCSSCGVPLNAGTPVQAATPIHEPIYIRRHGKHASSQRTVDRVSAGVFALILGAFGAHWFYLGKPGLGVLCLLTFWTGIPLISGIIFGIISLASDDQKFKDKIIW